MEWLSNIANIFTGGLTGGILGLFGSLGTSWLKSREKAADQEHEIKMRQMDKEMLIAEADNAVRLEQARAQTVVEQGAADAFIASQISSRVDVPSELAGKAWSWMANLFIFGEFMKGQVRVWLTALSVGMVAWLAYDNMPKDFNLEIGKEMARGISGMASMAFAWWFGSRQMTK